MRWVWIALGLILIVFGGLWLINRTWFPYGYGITMFGWGLPFGVFGAFFFIIFIMFVFTMVFWGSGRARELLA